MSRIKLDVPREFSFFVVIPIRITDINYGGHVGNDTILSLLHEARISFLKSLNYSEMNFAGAGLIMRDVVIEFKKEIFYGDVVKAYVTLGNFDRVGFDVFYKLVINEKEVLVALAKTGMVCYNYESKKIVSVPEVISGLFKQT